MQFPFITHGMVLYINDISTKTLTLRKCMCMRASLEIFGIFTFLNCYFFRYFVGTSDALSVEMTCLSAYMYRQISKSTDKFPNVPTKVRKDIIGGGGGQLPPPPLPPSGYANEHWWAVSVLANCLFQRLINYFCLLICNQLRNVMIHSFRLSYCFSPTAPFNDSVWKTNTYVYWTF